MTRTMIPFVIGLPRRRPRFLTPWIFQRFTLGGGVWLRVADTPHRTGIVGPTVWPDCDVRQGDDETNRTTDAEVPPTS